MPARNLTHGTLQVQDGAAHSITLALMEGDVQWEYKFEANVVKNRGILKEWTQAEQVPVTVKFTIHFEALTGKPASAVPTPFDAMTGTGQAAAWTSTNPNLLNSPFTTTLVLTEADVEGHAAGGYNEVASFTLFTLDTASFKEAKDSNKISFSGRALVKIPGLVRNAS